MKPLEAVGVEWVMINAHDARDAREHQDRLIPRAAISQVIKMSAQGDAGTEQAADFGGQDVLFVRLGPVSPSATHP